MRFNSVPCQVERSGLNLGALEPGMTTYWRNLLDQTQDLNFAYERLYELVDAYKFGMLNLGTATRQEIQDYAKAIAYRCERLARSAIKSGKSLLIDDTFKRILDSHGLVPSKPKLTAKAVRQLANPKWWAGRIRRMQGRQIEAVARRLNKVSAKTSIYCSRDGVQAYETNTFLSRQMMENTILENDAGDSFTLAELSDISVSNPRIRRIELMVRCSGFEQYAKKLGYVGMFYTLTCPSKYHASTYLKKSGYCKQNKKFEGASPREAQDYLCKVWARFRAWAKRHNLDLFGFRVAEPHHDGTPHWHLLLFVHPDCAERLTERFKEYALQEDPNEKGAQENRFEAVKIKEGINPNTGNPYSAAGYIAKYISKNIDAHGIDFEDYSVDAVQAANNTTAWARRNGIRQFQQFGGPSVSLWRECRRLIKQFATDAKACGDMEDLEKLLRTLSQKTDMNAADAWAYFCEAPEVRRMQIQKAVRTEIREERIDWLTAEVRPEGRQEKIGVYNEPVQSICGINFKGRVLFTRMHQWTKKTLFKNRDRTESGPDLLKGAHAPPWSSINNCTENYIDEQNDTFERCQSELERLAANCETFASRGGEHQEQERFGFYGESTACGNDGSRFDSLVGDHGGMLRGSHQLPRPHGGNQCITLNASNAPFAKGAQS